MNEEQYQERMRQLIAPINARYATEPNDWDYPESRGACYAAEVDIAIHEECQSDPAFRRAHETMGELFERPLPPPPSWEKIFREINDSP